MKTKAFRIAGGVALLAFGAPLPACAQFTYPMIIVPPPAQNYVVPKPAPKAPPPEQAQACGRAEPRGCEPVLPGQGEGLPLVASVNQSGRVVERPFVRLFMP